MNYRIFNIDRGEYFTGKCNDFKLMKKCRKKLKKRLKQSFSIHGLIGDKVKAIL